MAITILIPLDIVATCAVVVAHHTHAYVLAIFLNPPLFFHRHLLVVRVSDLFSFVGRQVHKVVAKEKERLKRVSLG